MCQLTYLDNSKLTLHKYLPALLAWNSEKNPHGFGMNLNADPTKIETWGENFVTAFSESNRKLSKYPLYGIFHVRLATTKIKALKKEFSHPFIENEIILAHNGTLREDYYLPKEEDAVIKGDLIDSQKYLKMLAYLKGDKPLSPKILQKSMERFTGTFAFLIRETKFPNQITIARGWTKNLHYALIKNGGKNVGMVINTHEYNLQGWLDFVASFYKGMDFTIKQFERESVYRYEVGSHKEPEKIGELIEDSDNKPKAVPVKTYHHGSRYQKPAVATTTPAIGYGHQKPLVKSVVKADDKTPKTTFTDVYGVVNDVVDKALTYQFSVSELNHICEVCFGKSVFSLYIQEMAFLNKLLERMAGFAHKTTKDSWLNLLVSPKYIEMPEHNIYRTLGLEFPYIFNSPNLLKEKLNK